MPPLDRDSSDAEDAAAHIAEMVRRTAVRQAAAGPSSAARPEPTIVQPQDPTAASPTAASPMAASPTAASPMAASPMTASPMAASPTAQPEPRRVRPAMRLPSPRVLAAGGVAVAVLIAGVALLSLPGGPEAGPTPAAQTQTTPAAAPAGYAVKLTDVITNCENHSYGRTKRSFKVRNCVTATRSLATGQVSGRQTLFVTSRIKMASVTAATSIKRTLDADGTGNLNDLLREGKTFPGAPAKMSSSGYASVQKGTVVLVAEAGFADGGPSSNTNPALRAAAVQVAALDTPTG